MAASQDVQAILAALQGDCDTADTSHERHSHHNSSATTCSDTSAAGPAIADAESWPARSCLLRSRAYSTSTAAERLPSVSTARGVWQHQLE